MSKYRDRFGVPINAGDVVATAITINHDSYRGFSFVTRIVKRDGRRLVLDGSRTSCFLSDMPQRQMVKMTPETDLHEVEALFIREFGAKR